MIQRLPRRTGSSPACNYPQLEPHPCRSAWGGGYAWASSSWPVCCWACLRRARRSPITLPRRRSPTPRRPGVRRRCWCRSARPTNLTLSSAHGAILRADPALAPTLAAWGLTQAAEGTSGSGLYRLEGAPGLDVAGAVGAGPAGVVLDAAPDYRVQADLRLPNDADYAQYQWALPQIQAPVAWDVTTGNADIILASLDTGVRRITPSGGEAAARHRYRQQRRRAL